jgi:hypothetical protein
MDTLPDQSTGSPPNRRRPNFVLLWVIVTSLWTAATILRIQQIWVPIQGWDAVIGSVYTWISLFLPPWMFAIILLAVKRIGAARHKSDG